MSEPGSPEHPAPDAEAIELSPGTNQAPRAHLVPSFILPELNSHPKMFKMKILKLNLIHSAFIFSVILVPNLWLGAMQMPCVCVPLFLPVAATFCTGSFFTEHSS